MRYIVYGAGAIGGVVGGRLFTHGLDVLLIARGGHLSAIQRCGLTIESPLSSITLRMPAVEHPSQTRFHLTEDVVLLATKTQDSARALGELRNAAGSQISVVCLQNGVESARIALRRFERVAGAITILPSAHLQAGIVQAFSTPVPGILDVGRFPAGEDGRLATVSADLRRAGFLSDVRSDILRWQHGKLLDNLKNVLQALCGPDAHYAEVVQEMRAEAEACYRAAGIPYAPEAELRSRREGVLNLGNINGVARPGDSSWQSLARATGSIETDFLNGEITMLGRLHGIATPINAMVQDLAARCAREHRPPASIPVEDLRRLRRQAANVQGGERLP
jgi:2-dehydropantoate 2-reductase